MKRLFAAAAAVTAALVLSGCGIVGEIKESAVGIYNMTQREERSQELCEEIFECFKNRDTQALTELFCAEVKNSHNLEAEIEQAYEYIGNVESYSDIEAENNASFHFVRDTLSNMITQNRINGIQTDGAELIFEIRHNLVWHDEACVGLHEIRIRTAYSDYDTPFYITIGETVETIEPQEIPDDYGEYDNKDNTGKIRRIYGENLLHALKSRDKAELEKLFAADVREQQDFGSQLDKLISFIDGGISSYSRIKDGGGGSAVRNGAVTDIHESLTIYDVMTDSGKMYEIRLYAYMIDTENPDNAGIHYLTVKEIEPELTNLDHKVIGELTIECDE